MKGLPWRAKAYLFAICIAGLASVWWSQTNPSLRTTRPLWEVGLFVITAVLAGGRKIALHRSLGTDESGSMTLGFAITFASMIWCGAGTAVVVAVASSLSSCVYPQRQPMHQLTFNVSMTALEALCGGLVFMALDPGDINAHAVQFFVAQALSAITYYAVNTFGVATIIALCASEPVFKVWKENFLWTAPSYLATASVTTLAIFLFHSSIGAVFLFVVPVAYLAYQTYRTYISRVEDQEEHQKELEREQAHLAELYLATIKSLALAIDAKDQYTHQHIIRVQRYAVAIAKEMGLTGAELEAVNTGALLHDIGKLGVAEYVLMKPGRLTQDEFDQIKKHPEIGEAILDPVEFPWPVLPVVRSHHEKWDGTGYPDGLKGEEIPLTARIMAVADVYDALTSTRSYRNAWSHEKAVGVIQKDVWTHFDGNVVEAFSKVIDGVVQEMAEEGQGPLAPKPAPKAEPANKSEMAANDIAKSSTELWALYEVAQTLTCSLGTQDTVDYLCRKLDRMFPGALFAFLLRDDEESPLRVRAATGLNEEYFANARPINERSVSNVALRELVTITGEYDSDDLLIGAVEGVPWAPLNTSVIVPLTCQGERIGTLNCYHPDPEGFSDHDRGVFENVAKRAAHALYNSVLFERMRGDTAKDPLTQTFNLRYLTSYLESKCRLAGEAAIEPFSVLCVDLDSFRPINENFGHQKGDQVLREVAQVLSSCVSPDDVIARYGGDEFLVVLSSADKAAAQEFVQRVEHAVSLYDAQLYHVRLGQLSVSVSVGIASYPEDGFDFASLVAAAESAANTAKAEKRLRSLANPSSVRKAA
ncbi:MAG TPA: diguanylate cyclase [Fimbriimonas sp.]|nr:diguanylate cyclase [Fimbriimonas sp.]